MGQVENASDARSAETALLGAAGAPRSLAPADSADIPPPEIRAPGLVSTSAPAHDVPHVALVPRRASGTVLPARPASGAQPTPVAAATSPYDRIAALSAVPLTQPPAPVAAREDGVMTELLATATAWAGIGGDYLRAHWREVGLIATMVILSGLLFWRLGERSRHADQELVLDFEAMPLVYEMTQEPAEEAAHEAVLELAHEAAPPPLPVLRLEDLEPELEPEGFPLPVPAVSRRETPVEDELILQKSLPLRRFATLREAIQAMKADMAEGDLARSPAVIA